jgi:putative acetyltransferase
MPLQEGVYPIGPTEFPRVVDVWEASVRATHHFVAEADIAIFRPLVEAALPHVPALLGVRGEDGLVAGFIGVKTDEVEMLFIHPAWRGQGAGKRLLRYAVTEWGATRLDVNEQNEQAVGFYHAMGFEVAGRSELDGMGKPYPLLHMRLARGAKHEA